MARGYVFLSPVMLIDEGTVLGFVQCVVQPDVLFTGLIDASRASKLPVSSREDGNIFHGVH
jgi:hypothetical protein